jgi:hypothetical protein
MSRRQLILAEAMTVVFLILILRLPPALFAQFTPEEIARRPDIEGFLASAEIIRWEEIGEGVTKPYRVFLRKGDLEMKACWKNPSGIQFGFLEGWQYEIAAYRLDKIIGLNMIPPAVEREFRGKKGALSYWAENKYSLLKITDLNIKFPDSVSLSVDRMKYVTRAWDSLIANEDRTQQNILYTEDWRTILIDHSRSFRATKEFNKKLMFGNNGIKKSADGRPFLFRALPRSFVGSIRHLTFDGVKQAVGPYLQDEEISAVLVRRDLLLKEIEDMIRKQGESKVLY